ncbi:uncharacterized protein LOC143210509 [Lasioglossum baleicum]|uniref:uncharacterized protein LOC143210509 n=1 Tax=Lasioglossum baleicum TaxID=434251 RepID=UPI003FCECB45
MPVCVVPGCKSGSKVPGHFFPKDTVRALQWKQAVNSSRLDGLLDQEFKKCYVCALRFTEDDVIPTLVRRKLKHNAVPSLLLLRRDHVHNVEDTAEELDTHLEEEMYVDFPEDNIALNLQEEDKAAEAEVSIPKRRRKNVHRKILSTMTPNAKQRYQRYQRYNVAKTWKIQQYNNQRKLKRFKMQLALANKFIKDNSLKKFDKSNPAQKLFVQMQLCNVDKKAKVISLYKYVDIIC